jgi:hypothetical protein
LRSELAPRISSCEYEENFAIICGSFAHIFYFYLLETSCSRLPDVAQNSLEKLHCSNHAFASFDCFQISEYSEHVHNCKVGRGRLHVTNLEHVILNSCNTNRRTSCQRTFLDFLVVPAALFLLISKTAQQQAECSLSSRESSTATITAFRPRWYYSAYP